MAEKLTDSQVWDLIHAALETLGDNSGQTIVADAALRSARINLRWLQRTIIAAEGVLLEADACGRSMEEPNYLE